MNLDPAVAAAERTEAARNMIAQAQADTVDLVTVSALELCVLGGPKQPLFDERVARAWVQLGARRRHKVIEEVTAGMVQRGLLVDDNPQRGRRQHASTFSVKPELGLMLAARCRPWSIVVAEAGRAELRTPRVFALGDQAEPVRAVVVEEPVTLPEDIAGRFQQVRKLGPLGWFYQYSLVSRDKAAAVLAALTISPPRHSGEVVAPVWTVAAYYPGSGNPAGERLSVMGDGAKATLDGPIVGNGDLGAAAYDGEGLRAIMLHLIAGPARDA
jgi:hypothetical protein